MSRASGLLVVMVAGWLPGPLALALEPAEEARAAERPNVVILLADQWRASATGYAGDPNARTSRLDRLFGQSVSFRTAVSGCPVCCPYRASLLTGQYPLTHGVFLNDASLAPERETIAEVYAAAGYDTAYIGKWHVDGHGRSSYIPPERRQGFRYWRALECTHAYNRSAYYAGDDPRKRTWKGYDAIAQTEDAIGYLRERGPKGPFLLVLSWGPPHNPYQSAPEEYRRRFRPEDVALAPDVPPEHAAAARRDLAGYYAHVAALDDCVGRIVDTLDDLGLAERTILLFTSDHGDMLHSHGQVRKQKPRDEVILVPFLLRYPGELGRWGRVVDAPINTPDILPTLLGLSGLPIPESVEGISYAPFLRGEAPAPREAALITCPAPFGEWRRGRGGKEYRGVRTRRYTWVRDLDGPWLLFDDEQDPWQLHNLAEEPSARPLRERLDAILQRELERTGDRFRPAGEYIRKWGYQTDATGTVPYTN